MKKRLFVFGCSLSVYSWPTWSTMMSTGDFDQVENWALAGLGNRAILERLIECNVKNKFTKNDIILIQWSTHLRNDFFHQEGLLLDRVAGWKTSGSIFNYKNVKIYDETWLKTFFDEEAFLYHTLNFIVAAQNLLENIGCVWFMTSIGDIRNLGNDLEVDDTYGENSIFKKISNLFNQKEWPLYTLSPSLKIYDEEIWNKHQDKWITPILPFLKKNYKETLNYKFFNTEYQKFWTDEHPTPAAHLFWLENCFLTKTNISVNKDICKKMCEETDKIYNSSGFDFIVFEKKMYHLKFPKTVWPENILGFMQFKESK